ncbi:MAG: indole-3-glycerol phosphate synthase TrpC, partial [Pseudomonadota bacterium]|nr:indole-3-glycerol phosphate synthase TrpC [Pseudomonadota bacterium]
MSVLAQICADKADHVAAQKQRVPLTELESRAKAQTPPRGFIKAIQHKNANNKPAIIAEVKKASPSKGLIATDFDPVATARAYQDKGAACVSVLTDTPYFQGTDDDFNAARAAIALPMIRKDFMVDPYQIIESRAMGADCILIIMAALDDTLAKELADTARAYDLDI